MSLPFIVISDGFDPILFNQFKNHTQLKVHPESKLKPQELASLLPQINGLIIRSATKVNQELIDMAPNLKLVVRAGEGTDNIDKKSL